MMIMGRSNSGHMPIAMLCIPKEETGDRLKLIIAEDFKIENGNPSWKTEKVFYDLNEALREWFNYERSGLRSIATSMAACAEA